MAKFFGVVLRIGLLLVAIVCEVVFLRYSVIYITTTYRLEWTGPDGTVWWHPVDVIVGEEKDMAVSFSNYWTKNNECYELKVYRGSSSRLVPNDQVMICLMSGSKVTDMETVYLRPVVYDAGTVCHMVVFPKRFSPRQEGDSLKLHLTFRGRDNVVCLVYKARLIRHCFDIFTDIT